MPRKSIALCVLASLLAAAGAVADCRQGVVGEYLRAIEALDWDAMHALLAVDASYEDPTAALVDEAVVLKGRDAIRDFWKSSAEASGTTSIRYDMGHCFQAGPVAVLQVKGTVRGSGRLWNLPREAVDIPMNLTLALTVEESSEEGKGTILRHVDYVDYASTFAHLERLRVPFEVAEATVTEIQEAIVSGRVTCQEVVRAYLQRIETYDQPTGLNAVSMLHPKALERAAETDLALARGETLGPLFCAPILVKDNFDTHDLPTTGGSEVLRYSQPPDDAFMVRKLRQAGAIVIAKTNMAEWAFSPRQTVSSSHGVTANAYDLERVPAGSSGGTASGVAASFAVAGLGSDTGNSIRGPSSHLALFGIRSTLGLTSRDGVIPLAFDRDIAGPMTRTVEDGARLFDVLAGVDPADPLTENGRGRRELDYTARLRRDGLRDARIGVLRALADPEASDPRVLALFEAALEDLRKAGATVVDGVDIPRWQQHLDGNYFCPRFRHDMWLYLASLGEAAPIHDVKEAFDSGRYSPHAKESFTFFMDYPAEVPPEGWAKPCPTFPHHPGRQDFLADVTRAMDEARIDGLAYPTWTHPPARLEKAREEYRGDNSQIVAPATGMPAVTVPMGFVDGRLPAGLQILGRPYSDGLLIQLAYAYEQATLHRQPPPGFPALAAAGAQALPRKGAD